MPAFKPDWSDCDFDENGVIQAADFEVASQIRKALYGEIDKKQHSQAAVNNRIEDLSVDQRIEYDVNYNGKMDFNDDDIKRLYDLLLT